MDIDSYILGRKSAGGGSTPTYQEKEVDITENTTTDITPDDGYDALSKVIVTTNVGGNLTFDKTNASVSYATAGADADITFGGMHGEPKMYVFTQSYEDYTATSADNIILSTTAYSKTTCQYWDGVSATAVNLWETLKNPETGRVTQMCGHTKNVPKGTYDSTNNTFTIHGVSIPYQVSGNYTSKPYGLIYFY